MEIQWPLVLFTTLSGAGSWLLVFTGLNEFTGNGKNEKVRNLSLIIGVVLAAIGGCSSVLHLSHPENMMYALSHPTSGIFVEAVLVGLLAIAAIVYFVMARRGASRTAIKVIAVITMALGVILSYSAGSSYMMEARPAWNTMLLPLGYLGTAAVVGASLYALLQVALKEEEKALRFTGLCVAVTAVLAGVTGLAFAASAGVLMGDDALLVWGGIALCGAVVPLVCGIVMRMKTSLVLTLAVVAVLGSFVGCVCYRVLMWLVGNTDVLNFFSRALFFGQI